MNGITPTPDSLKYFSETPIEKPTKFEYKLQTFVKQLISRQTELAKNQFDLRNPAPGKERFFVWGIANKMVDVKCSGDKKSITNKLTPRHKELLNRLEKDIPQKMSENNREILNTALLFHEHLTGDIDHLGDEANETRKKMIEASADQRKSMKPIVTKKLVSSRPTLLA